MQYQFNNIKNVKIIRALLIMKRLTEKDYTTALFLTNQKIKREFMQRNFGV